MRGSFGRAELVDGVPQEYVDASLNDVVPAEGAAAFEAEVRDLYEWAKLLDLETTAPSAVERLEAKRATADATP